MYGEQNVGKSSIAQRFCNNIFTGQHVATIGGAYQQQKVVLSNGQTIKYHIWDTGGQERFRSMGNLYYKDASAAILTYDITNEKTLEALNYWINELTSKCNPEKMVICLVGNKCDVENSERKVSKEIGKSNFLYSLILFIFLKVLLTRIIYFFLKLRLKMIWGLRIYLIQLLRKFMKCEEYFIMNEDIFVVNFIFIKKYFIMNKNKLKKILEIIICF